MSPSAWVTDDFSGAVGVVVEASRRKDLEGRGKDIVGEDEHLHVLVT